MKDEERLPQDLADILGASLFARKANAGTQEIVCPKCGAKLRNPVVKLDGMKTTELCDQCGAPLGEEIPMAGLALMKALGVRTDAPAQAGE